MFAVMPIYSPKHVASLRPAFSGSHDISRTEAALVAAAAAFVLAAVAPSVAFAIAVVAGIGAVAWVGLRVAATAPDALVEAKEDALTRASATQISLAR